MCQTYFDLINVDLLVFFLELFHTDLHSIHLANGTKYPLIIRQQKLTSLTYETVNLDSPPIIQIARLNVT